jgi:hypothetical protein
VLIAVAPRFYERYEDCVDHFNGEDVFGRAVRTDGDVVAGVTFDRSDEVQLVAVRAFEHRIGD